MRPPALLALLLVAPLAGCVGGQEQAATPAEVLADACAPEAAAPGCALDECAAWTRDHGPPLVCAGGIAVLHPDALEARRGGTGPWSDRLNFTVEQPLVQMEASPTPSVDGDSETLALVPGDRELVEVRMRDAASLSDYRLEWYVEDPAPCQCEAGTVRAIAAGAGPADQPFDFIAEGPGVHRVQVLLYRFGNDTLVAGSLFGLPVAVHMHWRVEGTVHPLRLNGVSTLEPADMADIFLVPGIHPDGTLVAQVNYRGEVAPTDGTEVDLGIYDREGQPLRCSRSHAADVPGQEVLQAREHLEASGQETGDGARVWVGAQQCAASGSWDYANTGPVPYTLDVFVLYE